MLPLPLLALDTANFAAIREQGQAYVDKTVYIQALLEERTRYAFLARPRRFGKSLLVSALARLFERTDDDLFRGLDIEKSGFLAHVPRVPALVLNMARVGGETPQEVRSELSRLVRRQSRRFDFEPSETIPPWSALDDLCDHLQHQHGQFAIFVDEYDAPLTDICWPILCFRRKINSRFNSICVISIARWKTGTTRSASFSLRASCRLPAPACSRL